MIKYFVCPDGEQIEVSNCLLDGGCRMKDRCATRSYLRLVSTDRKWKGKPSTTMLIQGTMEAFLKLTKDYAVQPYQRAFMIHGTKSHANLEGVDDDYSILEERLDDEITGIPDVLECENGRNILVDYKTSGSFKVCKALGIYTEKVPTGEVYKSGKNQGQPKTKNEKRQDDSKIHMWEWELQINKYRMGFEKRGFQIHEMKIQCIVRDGGLALAKGRGLDKNVYYFPVKRLDNDYVVRYFQEKKEALLLALKQGHWDTPCTDKENWDGGKCEKYCDVWEHCPQGVKLKSWEEAAKKEVK